MGEQINCIFLGKVVKKTYEFKNNYSMSTNSYYGEPYIKEITNTIKREKVLEQLIHKPIFSENEEIYLSNLNKYATIEKCAKSTDGSIIYNVTYVIETIEDKESKQSKEYAKQLLDIELPKYQAYLKEKDENRKAEQAELENSITKRNEILDKRYEWQRNNYKKINSVVVNKIPLDNTGKPLVSYQDAEYINQKLTTQFPKNYIVINTPLDMEVVNLNKESILEIIKKKLFKY